MIEMTSEQVNDVTVVRCVGSLDTAGSYDATDYLNALVDKGAKKFLLDFKDLKYISSLGLRVILTLSKKLDGPREAIGICSANEIVQDVFDITGCSNMFKIFLDKSSALKSFESRSR